MHPHDIFKADMPLMGAPTLADLPTTMLRCLNRDGDQPVPSA
jgi:hypothetical protein